MENNPQVSVIVTSYNMERTIERAIRSALTQRGVTLEIIVVDDCSVDNTWAVISALDDPRIKPIRLEQNSGPGAARNAAIAHASGAWLAVLDGDDAFLPGRLERCLKLAEAQHADIVVDNLMVHREQDSAEFPMFPPEQFSRLKTLDHITFIKGKLARSSRYTLGYLKPIFSAEFLRTHNLRYPTGIRIGEDYLLLAEALARGAICAVEHSMGYRYNARAGSISHRLTANDVMAMLDGDAYYLMFFPLDKKTQKAQRHRTEILKTQYAFALLVDAIKHHYITKALHIAVARPACIWLLWEPIWVRLKRCFT